MDEIADLLLHRAIERQVNRYARACDECDWAAWDMIFLPDVQANFGADYPVLTSAQELFAFLRSVRESCGRTQHLVGNLVVESIDPTTAKSRFYLRGFHRGKGEREHAIWDTMGEYRDVWKLTEQGWRIAQREHEMHTTVGTLDDILGRPYGSPPA